MVYRLKKRNRAQEIIKWLVSEERERMLKNKLLNAHPFDLAAAAVAVDAKTFERMVAYLSVDLIKLARVLAHVPPLKVVRLMERVPNDLATTLIETMEPDHAAEILKVLPEPTKKRLLSHMAEGTRNALVKRSRYDSQTAAGHMNTRYLLLKADMTVSDARQLLKEKTDQVELIDTLFVVGDQRALLGFVSIKDLLKSHKTKKIKSIVHKDYFSVRMDDTIEDVVEMMHKYDILAMPVLNDAHAIEGIINLFDVLDIIDQESIVDTFGFVGLPQYIRDGSAWFRVLFARISGSLGPALVYAFTALLMIVAWNGLEGVSYWWAFIPFILTVTALAGAQSLATTIADLHLDKQQLRHVFIDTKLGIGMACIVGILTFFALYVLDFPHWHLQLNGPIQAGIIAIISAMAVFLASFIASLVPALFKIIRINPSRIGVAWLQAVAQTAVIAVFIGLIWRVINH